MSLHFQAFFHSQRISPIKGFPFDKRTVVSGVSNGDTTPQILSVDRYNRNGAHLGNTGWSGQTRCRVPARVALSLRSRVNTYFNDGAFYDGKRACYRGASVQVSLTRNGMPRLSATVKWRAGNVIRDTATGMLPQRMVFTSGLRTKKRRGQVSFRSRVPTWNNSDPRSGPHFRRRAVASCRDSMRWKFVKRF